MFTPMQSLYVKGEAGTPLPTVWPSLEAKGTRFLRGQLCLICAGPGSGKSALALTFALKTEVPALYFSADSDAYTQLTRMVSVQTGWPMDKSAAAVRSNDLTEVEQELDLPIRFNYEASPTLDRIETVMKAYDEVMGEYPYLVIVDNITNVRSGGANDDDPFAGLEVTMEFLHDMARKSGSFVIGLHHVTGGYNDANKPIPISGVKGQISRVPEMILTLHRMSEEYGSDRLNVSTVKNRAGKMDPSGNTFVSLLFDGETMKITDSKD